MDQTPQNTNFQRRAFEICLAIYRLTNFFPKNEPLKKQLRKTSSQIIVSFALEQYRDIISNIEEIKIYLAIAKEQNWLKPINFDLLENAYFLLKEEALLIQEKNGIAVEQTELLEKNPATIPLSPAKKTIVILERSLNAQARQKKIVDYLKDKGKLASPDILGLLGKKISDRTIRNDLEILINAGLIKKIGDNKGAYYISG